MFAFFESERVQVISQLIVSFVIPNIFINKEQLCELHEILFGEWELHIDYTSFFRKEDDSL
jgi:hypothetical protein